MKWVGLFAALFLIVACFFPWIEIEPRNIIVKGVDEAGTNYGKRGYAHFFFLFFFIICSLIPRIWAKRVNIFVAALNLAWTISHFMVFRCEGGECPERQPAIWVVLASSVIIMLAALFPDMKPMSKNDNATS